MSEAPAKALVELAAADLIGGRVIYCPNPHMPLWSGHPKIFLDLGNTGEASCPYCGTTYRLKAGEKPSGHH